MKKLVALRFEGSDRAQEALDRVEKASSTGSITLVDALTISWPEEQRGPQTRRPRHLTALGKGVAVAQQVIFGTLYLCLQLGSVALYLTRQLLRHGIHPDFVAGVRDQIAPGTSILVVLVDEKKLAGISTLLDDMTPAEIGSNAFTYEEKDSGVS